MDRIGRPLRIYVSAPYTAKSEHLMERNVMNAVDAGLQLWRMGHRPYIPHLTHYVDKRARQTGICMEWEDYLEWDEAWIDVCDAILYLGDSNGAKREREYAEKKGKIIFEDLSEIPVISKKEGGICEQKESQTS